MYLYFEILTYVFVVSFCLHKDIHKLRLRRNLNFLDPFNPTRPDHEKPGKTARRTWSGKNKKTKMAAGAASWREHHPT